MLLRFALTTGPTALAQATDGPASLLQRLDPPTRAVVLMAILGLVLLGLTLIVLTMIGGRWVRRVARDRPPAREWPKRKDFEPPAPVGDGPQSPDASPDTVPGQGSGTDTLSQ